MREGVQLKPIAEETEPYTHMALEAALLQAVYRVSERNLQGHSQGVRGVTFSPDGKTIASASDDNTVILWNWQELDLDYLLVQGCDRVRDYLKNNPNVSESDRHLCDGIPAPK